MRLVARLRSGRLVYYAAGVFYLDGNGSIPYNKLRKLDRDGSIEWLDDELRVDFRTQTGQYGSEARKTVAIVHDDHRFDFLRAAKKFAIATVAFVLFLTTVAAALVFNSARTVASERAVATHEVRAAEARVAYSAFSDLRLATEDGVTLSGYAPAVKRAIKAREGFQPVDGPTIEIDERLAEAERLYAGAHDIWKIAASRHADEEFTEYKARRGDLGLTATQPEDAVQELWGRAYDHVAVALDELDAYEGVVRDGRRPAAPVTFAEVSAVIWERL